MSGIEFEAYVSELLRSVGVKDLSATPVTGDQGADLLFTWNGDKYVVQAKRYSGSVGNKAVQEAHAAKGFYGCQKAWVVSNSWFTPSARALAKELSIVLVDGDQLSDFASVAKLQLEPGESPD
jgi:restriction system protein